MKKELWQLTQEEKVADMVSGLRKMADWIEANGMSLEYEYITFHKSVYEKPKFKEMVKVFKTAGKLEKTFGDYCVTVRHHFSKSVYATLAISREQVCERVVTGIKEIPETLLPARTEEVVEWKCTDKTFTK